LQENEAQYKTLQLLNLGMKCAPMFDVLISFFFLSESSEENRANFL
jgi:hypothetical protein